MATHNQDVVVNTLEALSQVPLGSEHSAAASQHALDAVLQLTGFATGGVVEVTGTIRALAFRGDATAVVELVGRCAQMPNDQRWVVAERNETVELGAYGATTLIAWHAGGLWTVAYGLQPPPAETQLAAAKVVCDYLGALVENARLRRAHAQWVRETLLGENRDEIGAVTSGLAHHFNNLLGGMLGLVMLAPRLGKDELTALCERLKSQVEGANELTTNMLEVARAIRQRRADEVTELGRALRETIELIRPGIPEHVRIGLDIDETPARVVITETAFARIVSNLIQNAVQAAPDSDARVFVRLKTSVLSCTVEVEDNGPGVPLQSSERIFTPYVTLNGQGGSGIGLSTARSLAERARGSLVLGPSDEGARFVLELPLVS
ncbi:MAG: hypothetical protein A2289_22905 [Deltaproteobacteria bacterium RIFOXYA12_FULL_58_15]|nr:MAG: hypothetical protein A2289_22905 [Deltaproteobacteria bacterium RIFOXYA12_FULL_58_15]OGR08855.1 MAG: hypothetical protein A2341_27640 [Deltaproteobacteria bacterium RIFOXYB12_FULL_58_9]